MNSYDVSIIIPTYNVLRKTIDGELAIAIGLNTVLNQVSDRFTFEIIFVDDVSTDDTVSWLSSWAESNQNVAVTIIERSTNSGSPSIPRNDGIDAARGKWIAFMDNDDQMGGPGSLCELYSFAENWDSDVIIGEVRKKGKGNIARSLFEKGNFERVDFNIINPLANIGVWSRLFRREFIDRIHARFPDENVTHEDWYFNAQIFANTDKISLITNQVYYYWVDTDVAHLSSDLSWAYQLQCEQNINSIDFFRTSEHPSKYRNGAAFISRVMASGVFKHTYSVDNDRSAFMVHAQMHAKFVRQMESMNYIEYLPYMARDDQRLLKIVLDTDFTRARELFQAHRATNRPDLFLRLSPPCITKDSSTNLLRTNDLIDTLLTGHAFGEIIVDLSTEVLSVTVDSLNSKDEVLIISPRNLNRFAVYPFTPAGEIKIPTSSILDVSKGGGTLDFYIGRQSSFGIAAKMVHGRYSGNTQGFKEMPNSKFYPNWKGGLSLNIK
ncbi:MAG: glycosyltransferase [Cellulomonadaceae bacterium]|jgi:glycosyltransferase involved in cell wall biosynthesis|nr:glycosyltransferase [Cellulomonadaceae bacterium]